MTMLEAAVRHHRYLSALRSMRQAVREGRIVNLSPGYGGLIYGKEDEKLVLEWMNFRPPGQWFNMHTDGEVLRA